jgi:hypothetical protein
VRWQAQPAYGVVPVVPADPVPGDPVPALVVPADLAPVLVVPANLAPALVVPADPAPVPVVQADLAPGPAAREGRAERLSDGLAVSRLYRFSREAGVRLAP